MDLEAPRRRDFTLDQDQRSVRDTFADFFAKESPTSVVRDAEPLGFSAKLWAKLRAMNLPAIGLPESADGDGATLVDLVLVAEECGRAVAPAPVVSQLAAARLLARAGGAADVLAGVASGARLVALAPQQIRTDRRQLVPDAALACDVLAWSGADLALYTAGRPAPHVTNQGSTPLAWFDPADSLRTELLAGPAAGEMFHAAVAEWKLLTAAALVGIADAALRLGTEFARTRRTLGVSIGTLQGVSHPLADVATAVAGARNLVREAAWFMENEPEARPELPYIALDYAVRTATESAWISAHVQGGLGFSVEADCSLYFLRAKGWGALAGDRTADRQLIAAARMRTAGIAGG
jgi:alkylation response protein AidB-like acyl-CoA dehydrogenase